MDLPKNTLLDGGNSVYSWKLHLPFGSGTIGDSYGGLELWAGQGRAGQGGFVFSGRREQEKGAWGCGGISFGPGNQIIWGHIHKKKESWERNEFH